MASKGNITLNTQLTLDDYQTNFSPILQDDHTLTPSELNYNEEQAEKMRKYKKFSEEDIQNVLSSANSANMVIQTIKSDGTVIFEGKTDTGTYIVDCKLGFRQESMSSHSQATLEDCLTTIDKIPSLFKETLKEVKLSGRTGSSYYDGPERDGIVEIKKTFLSYEKDDAWDVRGVIIHEITHNFDYNGGHQNEFTLSSNPSFRRLMKTQKQNVSTYAGTYTYNYESGGEMVRGVPNPRYYTESLAEIMKVVGSHRLGYDDARIRVGNRYYITDTYAEYNGNHVKLMDYNSWEKEFPESAKLGNRLWDCKTREEAEQIFKDLKKIK